MAFTDLTTATRVKTYLEGADTSKDTLIGQLITGVSVRMERRLNRYVDASAARTEYFDLAPGQRTVFLKGYPIASVTSIHNDPYDRAYAASTLIASTDYTIELEDGRIAFPYYAPTTGQRALKIIYTGGMAATTAAFITAFPEIALACDWQVVHEFHNRTAPGASSVAIGGASIGFVSGLDWLPIVKEAIDGYRRMAHA